MKRGRCTYSGFSSPAFARCVCRLLSISAALYAVTLHGCALVSEKPTRISTPPCDPATSIDTATLREEIIRQATSLQYSQEVAAGLAEIVLSWGNTAKPALISYKSILEKSRQNIISSDKLTQTESLMAAKIARMIRYEITPNENVFDLSDIIMQRSANCLGYAQLFYIIGQSVGLSVRPVGVLELQESGPPPNGARHICCMVTLSDNTVAMINIPPPAFTSKPFVLESIYEKRSNYLRLRSRDNPLGIYRRIQILDENGLIAHLYNSRGTFLASHEKLSEAIDQYVKAIDLNPLFAEAWNNQAVAFSQCGDPNTALAAYNHAIELDPDYAEAFNNRAVAWVKLEHFEKAFSDYARATELRPQFAEACNNKATAYHKQGQLEQAIREYSRAIELNPELAQAYYNRGTAHGQLGNYRKAISDYSRAIKCNPHTCTPGSGSALRRDESGWRVEQAYINRGLSYAILGRHDAAKRDLLQAIELNPSATTLQLVGKISNRVGLDMHIDNSVFLSSSAQ